MRVSWTIGFRLVRLVVAAGLMLACGGRAEISSNEGQVGSQGAQGGSGGSTGNTADSGPCIPNGTGGVEVAKCYSNEECCSKLCIPATASYGLCNWCIGAGNPCSNDSNVTCCSNSCGADGKCAKGGYYSLCRTDVDCRSGYFCNPQTAQCEQR